MDHCAEEELRRDFTTCRQGRRHACVRTAWRDALTAALWRGEGCAPDPRGGRTRLLRFDYPGGTGLIRPYRRGGAMRHIVSRWYFADNRPLRELDALLRAQAAGLPIPEPLGAAWERRGPWLSGALATRELDGTDLLDVLQRAPGPSSELLERVGALFRRMHEAGLLHADLQVKNVLIVDGAPYLLDLDRARWLACVSPRQRLRNLRRFRRSLRKHGLDDAYPHVLRGYGPEKGEDAP